ncbi:MAG: hypothetical protein CME72_12280 [Halomonadaceae bacterium]|nr:hypothetical protein [Halomonadaceae bacterium]
MTHSITTVTPDNVPQLTYDGKPVVTTAVLAQLYGTEAKHIQNNYKRNEARFVSGKHYFKVEGSELKELKKQPSLRGLVSKMVAHLVLWTERGAARHAKMLETDQAWDVFEELEDHYFGSHQQAVEQQREALPSALTPAHQRALQRAIARRAQALPESVRRTAYSRIYSYLKDRFEVASYKDVPDERFTEALGAVESVALDGEYLPKPDPMEEGGLHLSPDEACNLLALCTHAKWMAQRWQADLGPALNALGSRHASECHEHVLAAGRIAHSMQRKAGVLPPAA